MKGARIAVYYAMIVPRYMLCVHLFLLPLPLVLSSLLLLSPFSISLFHTHSLSLSLSLSHTLFLSFFLFLSFSFSLARSLSVLSTLFCLSPSPSLLIFINSSSLREILQSLEWRVRPWVFSNRSPSVMMERAVTQTGRWKRSVKHALSQASGREKV